jgi:hypothetical protein
MTFFIIMASRILYWLGVVACIALIVSCFLPWAVYNDNKIHETFTGFYSYDNYYGKPGKFLCLASAVAFAFMLTNRLWAKRANLFICAFTLGYAIYIYILYTSCYNAYCPQRQSGIFLMIGSAVIMLMATIFPEFRIGKRNVIPKNEARLDDQVGQGSR